ncbi:MAG: Yip1 family protein [Thermincola sp.]|jgi:hypothetical protein|nr:Yip1 family protein [Thermincola sp.]MDT3703521.1 Yip1 family protein [Thermincola sp.]
MVIDEQKFASEELKDQSVLGLAELIYGVLFSPVRTFRRISDNPPLFHGFLVFFGVLFLTTLTNILVPSSIMTPTELNLVLARPRLLIGIMGAFLTLIGWFVQAGLFQLLAEFFGGKGRAMGVLTVLALARLPRVLMIPFYVLSYLLADSYFGRFFIIAASIIAFIWWAVLLVIGLREIQLFSTARALATLSIPLVILGLTFIVFAMALVGLVLPFIDGAFPLP